MANRKAAYMGIDPGVNGAIAVIFEDARRSPRLTPIPKDDSDLLSILASYQTNFDLAKVCIERVSGFIGKNMPGSHMFTFGVSYGRLLMALSACGIEAERVMPNVWQSHLEIPPREKGEKQYRWKKRLMMNAAIMHPGTEISLRTADALLIATYCWSRRHNP